MPLTSGIDKNCPAYSEELFGPVALMFKVSNDIEAIELANDSEFGLGASLWTKDISKARKLSLRIQSGTVSINSMVKSDPALPFGGIKKSGFGREMSEIGLKEFTNIKTINIF